MAVSAFRVVLVGLFPLGRVRSGQDGEEWCHGRRWAGTVMRHGTWMARPITFLPEGMPAGSLGRRLVAPAGRADLLTTMHRSAFGRAIALAAVTAGADPDLHPTVPALEDPVALFDGYRTSGTLALDKCGKRANTLRQLSSRAVRRRPLGENLGSPFF